MADVYWYREMDRLLWPYCVINPHAAVGHYTTIIPKVVKGGKRAIDYKAGGYCAYCCCLHY
jgi:hypothetical protein